MVGRLDNDVVIVTGAARGIGRAMVVAYAGEGARVVAVDRDADEAERTVAEIAGADGSGGVSFQEGDVADERRVGEIVDKVVERHGRIDVLVNNAGVQKEGRLLEQTVEDFHAVVDVNLLGTFLFTRAVVPHMLDAERGVVINLSSILGLVGDPVLPIYAATKAGILGFTRSVAIAYADRGIRVVAICPGDVDTELNRRYFASQPDPEAFRRRVESEYPAKRIADPDEIAKVALFLSTDEASFITGSHIVVDGGLISRAYQV